MGGGTNALFPPGLPATMGFVNAGRVLVLVLPLVLVVVLVDVDACVAPWPPTL